MMNSRLRERAPERRRRNRDWLCPKSCCLPASLGTNWRFMKQPLGRGLENLMPSDLSEDLPEDVSPSSLEDSQPPSGVERLIRGGQPQAAGDSAAFRPFTSASASQCSPARAPDWIFYLGDLSLMSASVWILVLGERPLDRPQALICLGLSVLAAAIGMWPWLRNVLYCQAVGESSRLPKWGVIAQGRDGENEARRLVIHLRKPQVAVEVHETAWNKIHAKPYWIHEPPNLPPGGVQALLEEAVEHFRRWKEESVVASKSASDPSHAAAKR